MPVDASIAMGYRPSVQLDDPMNKLAQMMQIQNAQQSNQLNGMKMDEYQRGKVRQNKMLELMGQLPADATDDQRMSTLKGAGFFDEADKINTSATTRRKVESEAAAKDWETKSKKLDYMSQAFGYVKDNPTAEAAIAVNRHLGEVGVLTPQQVAQAEQAIQANPNPEYIRANATRAFQSALSAKDQLPKLDNINAGGFNVGVSTNPITGQRTETGRTAITLSADKKAEIAAQAEQKRLDRAQALQISGLGPDGGPTPDMETTAKAIASGQLPPPTGMALTNPKNQRILARVMEINPQYDFTDVTAKRKAASDFTSGTQGNAMRSFAVSGQHLDQLGTLVDAMQNGDNQTLNKIGNTVATWNGATPVTNFNAAKDVVAKEVMKAIVGGGGGVSEREELAKSMSAANSPQQLKGVITQYRNLMAAQHDALLAQRRAAGLSDSTLPKYGDSVAPAAAPAGVPNGWSVVAH